MVIYIYVKTHLDTGLKYLGKTNNPNPHTYKGSGLRWMRHIEKHGYNVKTEILRECYTNDEVREWGLYYSNLLNVVESDEWANIKPESGNGGIYVKEIAEKISKSNTGKKRSDEAKEKMRQAAIGKIFTEEHRKKLSEARRNRSIKYQHSEETKRKIKESQVGRPLTEEHKAKLRKPMSEETKQKLRKPKGPMSELEKQKRREGQLRSWAKRKKNPLLPSN